MEDFGTKTKEDIDKSKNTQLIEVTEIKDNPLSVIKRDDKYYVMMGNKYRLSNEINTEKEAIENAQTITVERTLQLADIALMESETVKNQNSEIESLTTKLQRLSQSNEYLHDKISDLTALVVELTEKQNKKPKKRINP